MKISLVVRTLNEEKNIGKCLTAVLAQTRKPDEVLLVDNCSDDRTVAIAKDYQDKLPLRILTSDEVSYIGGLNRGVKAAKYDTVAFLSADCMPNQDWLKNLQKVMQEYKAAVVMGREEVSGDDDIHYVLQRTRFFSRRDKRIRFFVNSNIIYQKEILAKLLPFTGLGKKSGGEDTLLSIRYAREGYLAMRAGQAVVAHNVYDSMADFVDRTRQQGERLGEFFSHGWRYPRTYLNPFYWSLVEFLFFFRYFDKRFLKIAFLRLRYTLAGMFGKKFWG